MRCISVAGLRTRNDNVIIQEPTSGVILSAVSVYRALDETLGKITSYILILKTLSGNSNIFKKYL